MEKDLWDSISECTLAQILDMEKIYKEIGEETLNTDFCQRLGNKVQEVRTRFSGFDHTEDEWVNVETAVRERSIPLEPSECNMVQIGDLVMCYQGREHYQAYYDAHDVDIQMNSHDASGCACIFLEENISLDRLCRRPM